MLYNLIAFMVMMGVTENEIKRKVRKPVRVGFATPTPLQCDSRSSISEPDLHKMVTNRSKWRVQ